MKKYTIILLLLISAGLALAYFTIKQSIEYNQDVYLETTESVRQLKILDNNIVLSLFKIRYENNNDYAALEELSINLSDEFDNLRFEALFEEIESNKALEDATEAFDATLVEKQSNLEEFISHHKTLNQAYLLFREHSEEGSLLSEALKNLDIQKTINQVNINFYRFLQDSNDTNRHTLNNSIADVDNMSSSLSGQTIETISDYVRVLSEIIIESKETQQFFAKATNQDTTATLNQLELAYTNFHNKEIEKANTLRNTLIIYGLVLLALLIIFAYLLRKQYLSLEQQVADRTHEIAHAYNELKESQEQLIQSEKMASLGELVAGVAHEINTPLGYVNSNVDSVSLNMNDINIIMSELDSLYLEAISKERNNKRLSSRLTSTLKSYKQLRDDEILEENTQLLSDSCHGLSEISHLVTSLKDFARLDRQSTAEIDIHDCIDNSLKIASNHIKENNVEVIRMFDVLPSIICTPSKINQLFLNIITNAAQAMKTNGGALTISTEATLDYIIIHFADQGIGMNTETSQKMFDPFFTSKPIGEGTGLGMSIAYKIVQAHKGKINVISEINNGTTISIQLPILEESISEQSISEKLPIHSSAA